MDSKHYTLPNVKWLDDYLKVKVDHSLKCARVCLASQRQCIFICTLYLKYYVSRKTSFVSVHTGTKLARTS